MSVTAETTRREAPTPGASAALRDALRSTGIRTWPVIRAVLAGTMALGSAVGLSAVAAWLIAKAAEMPSPADLALAAVIVRFFGISRGLFRYLERLASHDTALRGMVELRERTYERLAAAGAGRVLTLSRGDIVARIGTDLDSVGDAVVRAIVPTGVAVTVSLISVGIVTAIIPVAGLVLAGCLALAGFGTAALTARQARIAAEAGVKAHAEVAATSLAAIESASEHRIWGTTSESLARVEHANRDAEAALEAEARPASAAAALLTVSQGLAIIGGVWLAVVAIDSGQVSGPWGTVVALLPLAAFEAVGAVPAAVQQLYRSRAAARRIQELTTPLAGTAFAATTGASKPADNTPADDADAAPHVENRTDPRVGTLTLDRLSVAWPGMTPTRPISAELHPGETLAIVGPSGIGKSTLLLAIAGAIPPHEGSALLDGAAVTPADTGHRIALTAEDAHVFETTVLENLRVARGDVTADEAAEALAAVGLDRWIAALPDGLDTMIGSGGHTVSGGERRRLLLARTMLHPAPVLLIDEPAEHLDKDGQDALRAVVTRLKAEGRIVVLVTHHESPLGYAERRVDLRG
ncbi:thiol reductant ABC exporter subunit CydC [Demequina zhanjiangensis]|uniref:Thiol reductant ABC exporter subunit CydC n=1 Tax=Demequina zhanjiangensis TaxID=3051659 RepID=A0ABT8G4R7_9MICO|nr:thiol reductant ABC exporter subunit CydC [Demequina sp. SYSU T00b26]MDN4474134.1 thiol reductant ABC exporter subunit CydC [Demequina sp. SYSU T00b26]